MNGLFGLLVFYSRFKRACSILVGHLPSYVVAKTEGDKHVEVNAKLAKDESSILSTSNKKTRHLSGLFLWS